MQDNNVKNHISAQKITGRRIKRKKWEKIVTALAAVVVFCTTYALIIPAITMEKSLICEKEEHTHSPECYRVLENGEVEVICGKEEHVHGDACYDAEASENFYTCGLGEHVHNESCYENGELKCTIPEHQHEESCLAIAMTATESEALKSQSDPTADLEFPEDWAAMFADMGFTGNWPTDILLAAESQLDYKESEKNFEIDEDGKKKGYTRYGAWYGLPYGDWCAMFCSFIMHYAGVEDFPTDSLCVSWVDKLKEAESFHEAGSGYEPKPGDLVFFDTKAEERIADYDRQMAEYLAKNEEQDTSENTSTEENVQLTDKAVIESADTAVKAAGNEASESAGSVLLLTAAVKEEVKTVTLTEEKEASAVSVEEKKEETVKEESVKEDKASEETEEAEALKEELKEEVKEEETEETVPADDEPELTFNSDHVGFVQFVFDDMITTVEGNSANAVRFKEYSRDDITIIGYGEMPENIPELEEQIIESEPAADGAAAVIEGMIPKGAKAVIEAVELTEEQLIAYFGEEKAAEMASFVAYDIKIMCGEKEWQPGEGVKVTVRKPEIKVTEDQTVSVAHVNSETETAEVVEAEITDTEEAEKSEASNSVNEETGKTIDVNFEAKGFSIYVIYTVDFAYNGVVFSINGYEEILLSELFEVLSIERDASKAVKVEFTNEEYVLIEELSEQKDWLLTSLAPFDTEETLTITFEDGEIIKIKVTDARTTYWEKITKADSNSQVSNDYPFMIVYEVDNKPRAILVNKKGTVSALNVSSMFTEVPPKDLEKTDGTFYKTDMAIDDSMLLGFNAKLPFKSMSGTPATNTGRVNSLYGNGSSYYLLPSRDGVIGTSNTNITVAIESGKYYFYSGDYYLKYSNSSFTAAKDKNGNYQFAIYRKISNPDDGKADPSDPGGGGSSDVDPVKPKYDRYEDAGNWFAPAIGSDGKLIKVKAFTNEEGEAFNALAYSDDPTSDIETMFDCYDGNLDKTAKDDGKVIVDKSVIYGGVDSYGAVEEAIAAGKITPSGDKDEFAITLSALAQKYAISDEFSVEVPFDVVFILDTSGSMTARANTAQGASTASRANVMIKALNSAMESIYKDNPYNRVGVVCFSGKGTRLLDLGRYIVNTDRGDKYAYFPENAYNDESGRADVLEPNANLVKLKENGTAYENVTSADYDNTGFYKGYFNQWQGTYTQDGIAEGAQVLLDNTDLVYKGVLHAEVEGQEVVTEYQAQRKPVIVLLSDGEPTYCTEYYNDVLNINNAISGDGSTTYTQNNKKYTTENDKGILGYYTILSAEYYKSLVTKHYNNDTYFLSVGVGITDADKDTHKKRDQYVSDSYRRAVLDPNYVEKLESGSNAHADVIQTSYMLRDDLKNAVADNTVISVLKRDNIVYGQKRTYTDTVTYKKNPYYSSSGDIKYNYADASKFMMDFDEDELLATFKTILDVKNDIPVYGIILRDTSKVVITDEIGEGMEVKTTPILRYGYDENNFYPVNEVTEGNVTTYFYSGTVADPVTGKEADLSQITVKVITDSNGNQSVSFEIPDSQLPAYEPNIKLVEGAGGKKEAKARFYYEALPVRLIYNVGLNDTAKEEVEALSTTGGSRTFYTNRYMGTNVYSSALFDPTLKNPYYSDEIFFSPEKVRVINKISGGNTTQTLAYSLNTNRASIHTDNMTEIMFDLGNNGLLAFDAQIPIEKQWLDVNGKPVPGEDIGTDKVEIYLYKVKDGRVTDTVTLEIKGNESWAEAFKNVKPLEEGESYYISEQYVPGTEGTYEFIYNIDIPVQKIWVDAEGKTIPIENRYPITASLYLVDRNAEANASANGKTYTPVMVDKPSIILNEENGYFNTFTGLPYPGANFEYRVIGEAAGHASEVLASYYQPGVSEDIKEIVKTGEGGKDEKIYAAKLPHISDTERLKVKITNTFKEMPIEKRWIYADGSPMDDDDIPVDSLSIKLFKDSSSGKDFTEESEVILTGETGEDGSEPWTGKFRNYASLNEGESYYISEEGIAGFLPEYVFSYKIDIPVTKTWAGSETKKNLKAALYVVDEKGKKTEIGDSRPELNQANSYSCIFEDLPYPGVNKKYHVVLYDAEGNVVQDNTEFDYSQTIKIKEFNEEDGTFTIDPVSVPIAYNALAVKLPRISNTEHLEIVVTNKPSHELPATGGRGRELLYLCGGMIILISLAGSCMLRRKEERREI